MNYALIDKNGVVINVIWLYPANADDFPGAMPMGDVLAEIGDTYADGSFYREGEKLLTVKEIMQAEQDDMRAALAVMEVTLDE